MIYLKTQFFSERLLRKQEKFPDPGQPLRKPEKLTEQERLLTYNLDVAIFLGDHQIMLAFDGQQTDLLKTHLNIS